MSRADSHDRDTLLARAAELARTPRERNGGGTGIDVVEFVLAGEHYALESRHVAEVFPFTEIATVPCTPPFVVGIINLRGSVLSVLDLKFFFQLPTRGMNDRNRAIVLRSKTMEFGILVDAMGGMRRIEPGSLLPGLPTLAGVRERYLRGVTPDGVAVLDGAKLLADEALVVRQT